MIERNYASRTLWTGDNLHILRGMNSETADLIYADPPFNSNRDYAAPVGSLAAGAAFKDTWDLSDLDVAWMGLIAEEQPAIAYLLDAAGKTHSKGMQSYLTMMAVRPLEMKRVLKPDGSIYLHCDSFASAYLKQLMDAIFGRDLFRNEITWKRSSNHNDANRFGRVGDRLLFYGDGIRRGRVMVPLSDENVESKYRFEDERGRYRRDNLSGPGHGGVNETWRDWNPSNIGRHWAVPRTGDYAAWIEDNLIPGYRAEANILTRLDLLDAAGLIAFTSNGTPELKRYLDASPGQVPPDVWTDIPPVNSQAKERVGYPTQKPLALLNRIIEASSDPGDLVLDPFCGCATACVAAEMLDREWVGMDISPKAAELVNVRLQQTMGDLFHHGYVTNRTDIPKRTDIDAPKNYRQNKHVLYGEQEGRCNGCETAFEFRHFHVDHIIPQKRGGSDHIENLQLLCGHCNSVKGDRDMAYLKARLKQLALT